MSALIYTHLDAVKALLNCKLGGGARDFCEQIAEDGFADEQGDRWDDGVKKAAKKQRERVEMLCLIYEVPLP